MTKQEKIREGIAECFYYYHGWDGETKWEDARDREIAYDFADAILRFQVKLGVVIEHIPCQGEDLTGCHLARTEPLIEEVE